MVQQISTVISDFALACSVFYVVLNLEYHLYPYFIVGLTILGIAASIGVARFGMKHAERTPVFKTHKFFSWLSAAAGMALIAYQFCLKYNSANLGGAILIFSAAATLTWPLQSADNKQLYSQACSGLSLLSITFLSLYAANWNGAAAGVIYMGGGMIFGSDGVFLSFQKVDWLHYVLVIGNLFFLKALS